MISIEEVNFGEVGEYLKSYYRDPTFWSTPRGLLNVLLIAQAVTAVLFMHKVIYRLWDHPYFWGSLMAGFCFVKYPLFAAIVCNKTRTSTQVGMALGAGAILTVYSLSTSLYWGHSQKCLDLSTDSIHMKQYCTPGVIDTMGSQSAAAAFLFLFFFASTVLMSFHMESILNAESSYSPISAIEPGTTSTGGIFNGLDMDDNAPVVFEKQGGFSQAPIKVSGHGSINV
jgi:hypothetical protein